MRNVESKMEVPCALEAYVAANGVGVVPQIHTVVKAAKANVMVVSPLEN